MKIMVRTIMKALPGKVEEMIELEKKHMAIQRRVLGISPRCYRLVSGGGDTMRTVICEAEFDSLAAFEDHPKKMIADSEMRAMIPEHAATIDSVKVEFYTPMNQEKI